MAKSVTKPKAESTSAGFDRLMTNVRRKTVVNFLRTWREFTTTTRLKITGEVRPDLDAKEEATFIRKQMLECIQAKGGEVSARSRTVELGKSYLNLSEKGRVRFLTLLAEEFGMDGELLNAQAAKLIEARNTAERGKLEQALRDTLVPPRVKILRQFNSLPNGFKFLVDMRADLLAAAKGNAALEGLEADLRNLLTSWFDVGLLDLEQITWNSPAALLEKLIAYEAVHEIRSWNDLKNRLDSDRRCYAFLHAKMPLEPLIFVEVALVKGLADSVQVLLDESTPVEDADEADTAIFYSISNAQKGLAGISFGNFLIKRVAERLSHELPNIKTFATLSPVPGFRHWLDAKLAKGDDILLPLEAKALQKAMKTESAATALRTWLDTAWLTDEAAAIQAAEPALTRLCAHYLVNEKKNGKAVDPVAHFHLTNGARLERINWLADTSPKGMKQAAGLMVNYLYKLSEINDNHEEYISSGTANHGRPVKGLLKG